MFDGEHIIALHTMQWNWASSCGEVEVSLFFSSCGGNLGYILELFCGWPFKAPFVQRPPDSGLVTRDTSVISSMLGRAIGTLLKVRWQTQGPFPVATGILGFLSIFKRIQSSTPFEALNSVCRSRYQRDVRPPVEMRLGTRAFSRVSQGDSDTPSGCEMKDEPTFKPLQGNLAFFRIRVSRCPFD